eukprot:gene315-275_t
MSSSGSGDPGSGPGVNGLPAIKFTPVAPEENDSDSLNTWDDEALLSASDTAHSLNPEDGRGSSLHPDRSQSPTFADVRKTKTGGSMMNLNIRPSMVAMQDFWDNTTSFAVREPQHVRTLLIEHLDSRLEDETISQETLDRCTIDRNRAAKEDMTSDHDIELLFFYHDVDGRDQWRITAHGRDFYTCERSLNMLSIREGTLFCKPRRFLIWVTSSRFFDYAILFLILVNSIILMIVDHRSPDSVAHEIETTAEPILTILFLIECIMKIVAMGFFWDRNSYLRDVWNWLDFIVVVTGTLSLFLQLASSGEEQNSELNWLRVFRVLRPLRSLSVLPQMKRLVNTLFMSVPRLGNVAGIMAFLLTILGILGINFFSGSMYRQCRITPEPVWNDVYNCWGWPACSTDGDPALGHLHCEERLCGGRYECLEPLTCGSTNIQEPYDKFKPSFNGSYDMQGFDWCQDTGTWMDTDPEYKLDWLNYGLTNFDNFAVAFLVLLQCITMEGWVFMMYLCQDGFSDWFGFVYFVVCIVLGSFFLMNVALAVVWESFNQLHKREQEQQVRIMARKQIAKKKAALLNAAAQKARGQKQGRAGFNIGQGAPGMVSKILSYNPTASNIASNTLGDTITDEQVKTAEAQFQNFPSAWSGHPFIVWAHWLADSVWLKTIVMMTIFANVVVMALDGYPYRHPEFLRTADLFNLIFTIICLVEMLIVHVGIGPRTYWKNWILAFDGVVTLISTLELMLPLDGFKVFRGFRLLRVFIKIAKGWKALGLLLCSLSQTLTSMRSFILLLFVMMVIFALMGISFFATKFKFDDDGNTLDIPGPFCDDNEGLFCIPRANFDNILWAMDSVFQVLSGENWNEIMYDGMRVNMGVGILYFVLLVLLGQAIILNLFLAILMSNFEQSNQSMKYKEKKKKVKQFMNQKKEEEKIIVKEEQAKVVNVFQRASLAHHQSKLTIDPKPKKELTDSSADSDKKTQPKARPEKHKRVQPQDTDEFPVDEELDSPKQFFGGTHPFAPDPKEKKDSDGKHTPSSGTSSTQAGTSKQVTNESLLTKNNTLSVMGIGKQGETPMSTFESSAGTFDSKTSKNTNATTNTESSSQVSHVQSTGSSNVDSNGHLIELEDGYPKHVAERSFYIFSKSNCFRKFCKRLVKHKWFNRTILGSIFISSIMMAADSPLDDPNGSTQILMDGFGTAFTVVFTIEMLCKMIYVGFVKYFKNGWNQLDAFVVVCSLIDEIGRTLDIEYLKVFRILRALRPLRIIARNDNLKLVVNTLFKSVPELCNVLVIGTMFFLIFGLFSLTYFKGAFMSCQIVDQNFPKGYDVQTMDQMFHQLDLECTPEYGCPGNVTPPPPKLCVNSWGAAIPRTYDEYDTESREWAQTECEETIQRPTYDTPICLASCNAGDDDDDRSQACPASVVSANGDVDVSALPDRCAKLVDNVYSFEYVERTKSITRTEIETNSTHIGSVERTLHYPYLSKENKFSYLSNQRLSMQDRELYQKRQRVSATQAQLNMIVDINGCTVRIVHVADNKIYFKGYRTTVWGCNENVESLSNAQWNLRNAILISYSGYERTHSCGKVARMGFDNLNNTNAIPITSRAQCRTAAAYVTYLEGSDSEPEFIEVGDDVTDLPQGCSIIGNTAYYKKNVGDVLQPNTTTDILCKSEIPQAPVTSHYDIPKPSPADNYFTSITQTNVMTCSTCESIYCTGDSNNQADSEDRARNREYCELHPLFCKHVCRTNNKPDDDKMETQECKYCLEECISAFSCTKYCEGYAYDAGLCIEQGGMWVKFKQNFDDFFAAFLTLVEISTTEGWVTVMHNAVDAVAPMWQPRVNKQPLWSIYWVLFIFVGNFFVVNLCVGVIVDNFNTIKKRDGVLLLTQRQQQWIAAVKASTAVGAFYPVYNLHKVPKRRRKLLDIILSPWVENSILFIILINTICMSMKIFPSPSSGYDDALQAINRFCGVVFFLEAVVKIYALRWNYFYDGWNLFDFTCVGVMCIGLIIELSTDVGAADAMSVIRVFRIARLFRLLRFAKGLKRMVTALVLSIPKLMNVALILLLLLLLFTVLGVQLFAQVQFAGEHNEHANFRNFYRAMQTLFRSMTGEGWNDIMHALGRDSLWFSRVLGQPCISDMDLQENYQALEDKCLTQEPMQCGIHILTKFYFSAFTL